MSTTVEKSGAEQSLQQPQAKFSFTKFLRMYGTQLGILAVFAAMWIFFIVAAPTTFLSPQIYLAFMWYCNS